MVIDMVYKWWAIKKERFAEEPGKKGNERKMEKGKKE